MEMCYHIGMKRKKRLRASLIKPNKRVPIENRGTTVNVSEKIHVTKK